MILTKKGQKENVSMDGFFESSKKRVDSIKRARFFAVRLKFAVCEKCGKIMAFIHYSS